MKRIFVLLAAIVLVLPLWARREPNVPQAYAYGVSLDVQGGYVLMPYSFYGEKRTALGIETGGEFQLRTTYFIGKHWGMFASFSYLSADMDDVAYFWTVNRADGGRYRYGRLPDSGYYSGSNRLSVDNDFSAAVFLVGAAYRYDFGGWSLCPRVGVGITNFSGDFKSYQRIPRDGSDPTVVGFKQIASSYPDYLAQPDLLDKKNISPAFSLSLQLCYTFNRHFYISAECGFKSFPNELRYSKNVYEFKKSFEPSNWAEAVGLSELEKRQIIDWGSEKISRTRLPFNFLNFNFGIGWYLGRNRYQSGRYSK